MLDESQPVAYLDVDDVLIRWEGRYRDSAPHAQEFIAFLLERFEVRWITSWCPGGVMREDRLQKLAEILGVPIDELRHIRNPRAFPGKPHGYPAKHHAIDFGEQRRWVWIEDEHLHRCNFDELERRDVIDHYIECNTSRRPDDLLRVRAILEERFGLRTVDDS
jgi:hypothetical protein